MKENQNPNVLALKALAAKHAYAVLWPEFKGLMDQDPLIEILAKRLWETPIAEMTEETIIRDTRLDLVRIVGGIRK